MNAKDLTLQGFLEKNLSGRYQISSTSLLMSFGYDEDSAANTESIIVDLEAPPEENALAALVVRYLLCCGFHIEGNVVPLVTPVGWEKISGFPDAQQYTSGAMIRGSSPDLGKVLVQVYHSDSSAAFIKSPIG